MSLRPIVCEVCRAHPKNDSSLRPAAADYCWQLKKLPKMIKNKNVLKIIHFFPKKLKEMSGARIILEFTRVQPGLTLNLPQDVAFQSETIRTQSEDMAGISAGDKTVVEKDVVIPMETEEPAQYNAVVNIFTYIKQQLQKDPKADPQERRDPDKLEEWEVEFFKPMTQGDVFNFLQMADFLHVPRALDTAAAIIAKEVPGKSPEALRRIFAIPAEGEPGMTVEDALAIKDKDE